MNPFNTNHYISLVNTHLIDFVILFNVFLFRVILLTAHKTRRGKSVENVTATVWSGELLPDGKMSTVLQEF